MAKYTRKQINNDGLPYVLSYLLPVINATSTISYGEVAKRLESDLKIGGRIFSTQIGGVVGSLMNRLHELDQQIPLINVLVVRKDKNGLPSEGVDGYLRERFGVKKDPLPSVLKASLVTKAALEVYAYPNWRQVYKEAFGNEPPDVTASGLPSGTEKDGKTPDGLGWGGQAESEEHKSLKNYIYTHPKLVGIKVRPDYAIVEKRLLSYDEVDVFFQVGLRVFLIEVKSIRSNTADLVRGVYQCIKYRAVFMAQCKIVMPSVEVTAILVTEESPSQEIISLAKLHKIQIRVVTVNISFGKIESSREIRNKQML